MKNLMTVGELRRLLIQYNDKTLILIYDCIDGDRLDLYDDAIDDNFHDTKGFIDININEGES